MANEIFKDDKRDNSYLVSETDRSLLTKRLLAERPPRGNQRSICYKFEGGDKFADIGRSIESEVFGKSFEGNDPDRMLEEYSPYEGSSIFFVTVDTENQRASGVLRVIENSTDGPDGFKTLDDLDEDKRNEFADFYKVTDFSKVWDIGTLAVLEDYRTRESSVSGVLYHAMYMEAKNKKVEHIVSVIDERVYDKLRKYIGMPFEPLLNMPPEEYIGTMSQFVHAKISELESGVRKKGRQLFFVPAIRKTSKLLLEGKPGVLQF